MWFYVFTGSTSNRDEGILFAGLTCKKEEGSFFSFSL